jgi:hypothetical protein
MTRIEVNLPPPNSNQTPIYFQSIPQGITTNYPHTTPNIDNYQGIPQQIRTPIAPGAGPDTYGALSFPGVPQHIRTAIRPGAGPDSYHTKKMSLGFDAGSVLGGLTVGFIFGAIIFTATGRKVAGAAGERVAYHVAPNR